MAHYTLHHIVPGGVGVVVGVPAQRELGTDLHRVRHAQQLQVRDLQWQWWGRQWGGCKYNCIKAECQVEEPRNELNNELK